MNDEIQIDNIINNRLVPATARTEFEGWSLPEASEQDVALAIKSCRTRRISSVTDNVEALAAVGRRGTWLSEEALQLISQRTGSAIKYLRMSIGRLNDWLAGLGVSLMVHGRPTPHGYRHETGFWTGGLSTTLVLAGDATAVGPLALAHTLMAGARTVVKGSRYEPLAPSLFLRALIDEGIAVPELLFFNGASESGGRYLQRMIEGTRQSVIYGEDLTINTIYGKVSSDASHKKVGFWAGRSGVLVLPDADLDVAARCIAVGTGEDRGNRCVSTSKAFVPASLMETLMPRLFRYTNAMVRGEPTDPTVDIGRLDPVAREQTMSAAATAEVLYDDQVVYVTCPDDHLLLREEMGYPVCAIRVYGDQEDPVEVVNRSVRGSSAGRSLEMTIVTHDPAAGEALAPQLDACKVLLNRATTDLDHTTTHQGIYLFRELMRFCSMS